MLLLARSVLSRSCVFSPNASLYKIVSLFVVAAAVSAALVLKKQKNLYETASTPTWRKIETQPL